MTDDPRAKAAGLDHLEGEDKAALDAGTALADELAAALPREHHMHEEPALTWRPEPGR